MKKYRISASSVNYLYLDIEAENEDQAWKIAYKSDGADYTLQGAGDWQIDGLTELEVA